MLSLSHFVFRNDNGGGTGSDQGCHVLVFVSFLGGAGVGQVMLGTVLEVFFYYL